MKNIPFLDLKKQYGTYREELERKLREFLPEQKFILGKEVEALEKEVADFCGSSFGIGVSSGSDALLVSLMALGIGPGTAVVTTPFTFFATAGAIARLGAEILFCDIDPVTFNLGIEKLSGLLEEEIEKKGSSKIKAVIPVHLFGQLADMGPLMALAEKYGLAVIEDAAQAVGSEYALNEGVKRACAIGTAGTLSFFPSKNLGAFGDAGMVLTDDPDLAQKMKRLRVHGSSDKYVYSQLGGNFRIDALQALILRIKLKHLDSWIRGRMEKAAVYDRAFQETGLDGAGQVLYPRCVYRETGIQYYHTYHQYVVRAGNRDGLRAHLSQKGIGTAVYYPLSLHQQDCFSYLGYKEGDFPESEKACSDVLAIPVYSEMTDEQQEYVIDCITEFYR